MAFVNEIKVRFNEVDDARVVYYPQFFDYFHRTFEDFMDTHGPGFHEMMRSHHVGWPSVHAEADYRTPLLFGSRLSLEMSLARLGNRSVTLGYRGTLAGSDLLVVEGKVIAACIDLATGQGQSIPKAYRDLFEHHLGTSLDG